MNKATTLIKLLEKYSGKKVMLEAKVVTLNDTDGDGIPSGKYVVLQTQKPQEENGVVVRNISTKEKIEIDKDYLKKYGKWSDEKIDDYDETSGAAPDMSEPVENNYNAIVNAIDASTGLKTNKPLFQFVALLIGKETPDFNKAGWTSKEPVKLESLKTQIENAIKILQKALDIINRVKK